mgnify:CR=1 FL=1
MKPVRKHISTRIFSRSLVGIGGKFPRGRGNYISVAENRNGHWLDVVTSEGFYQIVNLSAEDLEDAKALGLIGETMEADTYVQDDYRVAVVVDDRLPEICKKPRWWYAERFFFKEAILRNEFSIPDGQCICANPDARKHAVSFVQLIIKPEGRFEKMQCSVCKTSYLEERY